tara:strand:+ start:703 stop:1296 length:594 start_codon:yes stop_codon:yes gene_type:complete
MNSNEEDPKGGHNDEEVALYSDISARVTEMKHSKEMSEFFKGSDMTMCAPERVTEILYLWSQGWSQNKICKKLKADPYSVSTIVVEYADFGGKWRELGGKLAARAYLRLADLENELIDVVANKLSDGSLKVGFKDLKELSIAKANASREALTARGEASNISEERVVYTQEDYELAAKAAADRIKTMKRATTEEVTDV